MNIVIPNKTSRAFEMPPIDVEVWVEGARRTDAVCTECTMSADGQPGAATIHFPRATFDADLCRENDLVEIAVKPYGVIWRGYITARDSSFDRVTYTALDYLEKLNDCFFLHEYNFKDEVTGEIKYPYTIRQIAYEAYQTYYAWKTGTATDDFLLGIDLESFPDIVPNETHVLGQPLLQGLQTILETHDYRYKLKVTHTAQTSIASAFMLGSGAPRSINRGIDPTRPYFDQPGGAALAVSVQKTVDAKDCLTHVWAKGDNRVVETAFPLASGWRLVPDGFTPPPGDSILNYVTASEQAEVINNWDKYTVEKIDIKASDKFNAKVTNPNYRKKYERVCCNFTIPRFDNTYFYNDDPENYPTVYGELNRQAKIETDLVQTFDGQELKPFIVYKRFGDPTLHIQRDGFTIKDSTEVVFSKPFVDTVSNVLAKGVHGSYVAGSWNTGSGTSQYVALPSGAYPGGVIPSGVRLTDVIPSSQIGSSDGVWLVLGEYMVPYEITATTEGTVTVKGNLDGAGVVSNGSAEKGAHWFILNKMPVFAAGGGTGMTEGMYQINASGSTALDNKYAGMYLVLGDLDMATVGFKTKPADLKVYRIALSSGRYVWIDSPDTDLTGAPAKFMIVAPRTETKRPYELVILNAAYQSVQKLEWCSDNLSTMRNKRIVYKDNDQYQWRTEAGNYRLVKLPGEEDRYAVTYNGQVIDRRKDFDELTAWAANQLSGATSYSVNYDITLRPLDLNIHIGDRLLDTQVDTNTTVTAIAFDFANYQTRITAASWN